MIEYRLAQLSDADAIAHLHARSWRENYRGSYPDAFLDGELPAERIRVWRARLDQPAENQLVLVAFEGADLIGFICAYGAHDPRWGSFVDNLHVASTAKRHGIGASLMRQAAAWAESRYPSLGVHLLVLEVNSPARRFYERLGGQSAEVLTMETHGGAVVRSCRYVWPRASALATSAEQVFDPTSPAFRANPFPALHRLRETDPIHRTEWGLILTRYRDCTKVLGSRDFGMRGIRDLLRMGLGDGPAFQFISRRFQFVDPPEHTRIRSLTTKAFSARRVLDMRPRIQRLIDQLFDQVNAAQGFDLIAAVAYPLPAWVISEMLGTPMEDRDRLAAWTAPITRLQSPGPFSPTVLAAGNAAAAEFMTYVRALVDERRRRPGEDLLSALIAAEESGNRLSLDELVAGVIFLFNAGHHTTRDLIGNAVVALLRNRDQWELLLSDPSLILHAVEECMRYDPSITRTGRFALMDTELDGRKIVAGEPITCLLNAANRDPERFPDPDRFDIRRSDKEHLAFGGGIHFCLGATLARLETELVLGSLLRRYPGLHLATTELQWRDSITYRGPVAVNVEAR